MNAQMIRRALVAVAAAGSVSAVAPPAGAQEEEEVERIVVTTSRRAMQRPTLSVIEGIREHVVSCLDGQVDLPRNAPEVRFRVRIKEDGMLDGPPRAQPEPTGLEESTLYMRTVTAARQALYRCEPYDFLPSRERQHWEELELVFRAAK